MPISTVVAGLGGAADLSAISLIGVAAILILSCLLLAAYRFRMGRGFSERADRPRRCNRPLRTESPLPEYTTAACARLHPSAPRADARRRHAAASSEPPRAPVTPPASERPRILIVDDNTTVLRFVERALSDTYTVTSAGNGREALDVVSETMPDLIISDIMMPVMDGRELCRTVKEDPTLRHVPVVLLTALASQTDLIEGLELGSDDYICKPFNVRELKARVRNLIRARDEQRCLAVENRRLATLSERKSDLLSLAAHDLKNPLTAIRELADVVRDEVGEQSEAFIPADLIHRSSDQMLRLVSSLLESAAIDEGRIPMHPRDVDVADLALDVVHRNDALAERKSQTIELTMPREDCTACVDPQLIFEAMDNLVNNAVKYSPMEATIRVDVAREGAQVRFSVTDMGPGIAEDEQPLLFRKFQRLSAQPTGGESSSGLGLAVVKQIVDLHDGNVVVRSAPGSGSMFGIEIPVAISESALVGRA